MTYTKNPNPQLATGRKLVIRGEKQTGYFESSQCEGFGNGETE